MMLAGDQVLTAAQTLAAEERVMAAGTDVHALMQIAGRGAAEYVWRMSSGAPEGHGVTVLCGPGNNGGDGYVIAEAIRERGGDVAIVMAKEPSTDAARRAASLYGGAVIEADRARGSVLVDCMFGSGLNRALSPALSDLLKTLARSHAKSVAIDLPSGVATDTGALLSEYVPEYDLCVALAAWKPAHFLMPASARCKALRLVDIGIAREDGGATVVQPPRIMQPAADAHKYRRGLAVIVGGAMPGATMLSARAAAHGGAGYVKLLSRERTATPDWLVETQTGDGDLPNALSDDRIAAVLAGPGLGRDVNAAERLAAVLRCAAPRVVDADALVLLETRQTGPTILTPHEGELARLENTFGLAGDGSKPERAKAVAIASNAVVIAKGPDTVIAAPDGRLAYAERGPSWLSVAGTGDVLAGLAVSRLSVGGDPWRAACEAVWLHGEAARLAAPAFHAGDLADAVRDALMRRL